MSPRTRSFVSWLKSVMLFSRAAPISSLLGLISSRLLPDRLRYLRSKFQFLWAGMFSSRPPRWGKKKNSKKIEGLRTNSNRTASWRYCT